MIWVWDLTGVVSSYSFENLIDWVEGMGWDFPRD